MSIQLRGVDSTLQEEVKLQTTCIVCKDAVTIFHEREAYRDALMCKKCKEAILRMRKEIEEAE